MSKQEANADFVNSSWGEYMKGSIIEITYGDSPVLIGDYPYFKIGPFTKSLTYGLGVWRNSMMLNCKAKQKVNCVIPIITGSNNKSTLISFKKNNLR